MHIYTSTTSFIFLLCSCYRAEKNPKGAEPCSCFFLFSKDGTITLVDCKTILDRLGECAADEQDQVAVRAEQRVFGAVGGEVCEG